MRKLSSHFLFNGSEWLKNAIVVVDNEGEIVDVYTTEWQKEIEGVEFYNGILCPGFINAHCHLELSHLKNTFEQGTLLKGFIKQMQQINRHYSDEVLQAMKLADREMQEAGIVTCADITNTTNSLSVKENSPILYHSFIELFSPDEKLCSTIYSQGLNLVNQFSPFSHSLTPHAPYSVSFPLMEKICQYVKNEHSIISLHLFESSNEKELFKQFQKSESWERINSSLFYQNPTLLFALQLPKYNPILFVHNTFIQSEDMEILTSYFPNHCWVLCPNSNMFIENCLPPVSLLLKDESHICIGTDSYASNNSLSVLEELKTLHHYFPELTLQQLLSFATWQGAKALNVDHCFGSIEKGKKPGIVLLSNIDLLHLQLTEDTFIQRLI